MSNNYMSKLVSTGIKFTIIFMSFGSFAQNWVSTEFTPFDAFAISDVESHDGDLYATYSTGFGAILGKSENDGATWSEINLDGTVGFPTLLLSVGERLYLSTVNIVDSNLYYSTDGGSSFTLDNGGLPSGQLGGAILINRLQFLNNRLVVGVGGGGYYQKSMASPSDDFAQFDTPTGLNSGSDRLVFYNGSLYTYDNSGAFTFYQSSDFGINWTTPNSNGLPANLNSEILEVNPVTGRIYLSGVFDSNSQYGLYFTDDFGVNWNEFDLSMTAGTNYLGDFQKVTALYANGPLFLAALENDTAISHPDVISSTDLSSEAPSTDVIGLPSNAPGEVFGNKIIVHNNKPTLALNLIDIYIKDQTLAITDALTRNDIKVYPSQVKQNLTIESLVPFQGLVYNSMGKLVMELNSLDTIKNVNFSNFSAGIYYIRVTDNNGMNLTRKILKVN